MDADQVADLLGTMAIGAVVGMLVLLWLRALAPTRFATVRDQLAPAALWLAAGVAALAMAGSLWFSEVADFPPCRLCWYQRIAMYPLVLLLGLAAARRDHGIRLYGLALAGLGLAVSAWHNVVETFPDVESGACDPANPCTIRWVEGLGFWTIPRLAFVAFALILTLLLLDRPTPEEPA